MKTFRIIQARAIIAVFFATMAKLGAASALSYDLTGNLVGQQTVASASPTIIQQPIAHSVALGEGVGFSIVVSGNANLHYQWYRDGTAISGATSDSYYIDVASVSHQALYSVVVSNGSSTENASVSSSIVPLILAPYGLAGLWKGDNNAENALGGQTGILSGGASFGAGMNRSAFSFSGGGTTVAIPGAARTNLGGKSLWTVESWVKPTLGAGASSPDIFFGSGSRVSIGIARQSLLLTTSINGLYTITSTAPLKLNEWNHVALTYEPGGRKLYLNGVLVGQDFEFVPGVDATTAPITLGDGFIGLIDEFSIYDRALSPDEIRTIAAAGDAGKYPRSSTPENSLANMSVRAAAGSGDQTLIVGFNVAGTGAKQLLLRAVGPGLTPFGVGGVLPNPELSLFYGSDLYQRSDDWGGGPLLVELSARVGAFPLTANSNDSALSAFLDPGSYTAQVSNAGGGGVVLVEAYDASGPSSSHLSNLSARNFVGTGDATLIMGFVITGSGAKTLLIRGIGPTLTVFGVAGALNDPSLKLFRGQTLLLENDNWGGTSALTSAFAQVGAFSLGAASKDAAFIATLPPGAYTVQVSGNSGTTGVALVELYEIP